MRLLGGSFRTCLRNSRALLCCGYLVIAAGCVSTELEPRSGQTIWKYVPAQGADGIKGTIQGSVFLIGDSLQRVS